MRARIVTSVLLLMGCLPVAFTELIQAQEIAIRGATILTMEGPPIQGGVLLVRDGKIAALGSNASIPAGAQVIDAEGLTAMPGIIDAEGVAPGHGIRGLEGPMRAELIAGDFFDPYGRDYRPERTLRDLVEWGVTSVNVKLTDTNVFDGVSSVVKLYAPTTYEEHFVKYRAALRINLGEPPRSDEGRFPTTRMGIVGMVRENFIKAQDYQRRWDEFSASDDGEKAPPAREDKMEHLAAALRGDIPVLVHAVEPMDVEAALRIAEEFDLRLILTASSMLPEALIPELLDRGVPVILGTYFATINNHIEEQFGFRYETAAILSGAGVPVAFGGLRGETKFLSLNAGIAVQNGMDHQRALEGLTIVPARMLGVDHRIGSLAVGKDADIVLYRGDPLEITSPVEMVFIEGRLVFERSGFDPSYSNMKRGGGS
jgi:imidazolonepropionase-like amidohydrolase